MENQTGLALSEEAAVLMLRKDLVLDVGYPGVLIFLLPHRALAGP